MDADGPPEGPFSCPLDMSMNLEQLMTYHVVREHSFLENPRVPRAAIEGAATLTPPPEPMNSTELYDALYDRYNGTSILRFTGDMSAYLSDDEYIRKEHLPASAFYLQRGYRLADDGALPLGGTSGAGRRRRRLAG